MVAAERAAKSPRSPSRWHVSGAAASPRQGARVLCPSEPAVLRSFWSGTAARFGRRLPRARLPRLTSWGSVYEVREGTVRLALRTATTPRRGRVLRGWIIGLEPPCRSGFSTEYWTPTGLQLLFHSTFQIHHSLYTSIDSFPLAHHHVVVVFLVFVAMPPRRAKIPKNRPKGPQGQMPEESAFAPHK